MLALGCFFFEKIQNEEKKFINRLQSIPKTAEQIKADNFFDLAQGSKLLDKWRDFLYIDQLCKTYPQYTHDIVANMELITVQNLIVLNKEMSYITSKSQEIQKKT